MRQKSPAALQTVVIQEEGSEVTEVWLRSPGVVEKSPGVVEESRGHRRKSGGR